MTVQEGSQKMTPAVETISGADLDQLCINTIRTLSIDAVQQAKSEHPGTPMRWLR
jgi:transketolase